MIEQEGKTFHFSGPLTIATVNETLRESEALFAQEGDWDLDFSGVEEVDSAAVSLLLEWVRQAAQRGHHQLRIQHLSDNLQCLVKVYGVEELLPAA